MKKTFPLIKNHLDPFIALGNVSIEIDLKNISFETITINLDFEKKNLNKIFAGKNFETAMVLIPKLSFVQPHHFEELFSLACEDIFQIDVPLKAKIFRTILMEIERISAHLLFLYSISETLGFQVFKNWVLNDREEILQLIRNFIHNANELSNFIIPGGVLNDVLQNQIDILTNFWENYFNKRIQDYEKFFFNNIILSSKTSGLGIFDKEEIKKNKATGIILRSSGVNFDIRKNSPYEIYDKIDFQPVLFDRSDVYNRIKSLNFEIKNSIDIINQSIDMLKKVNDEKFLVDNVFNRDYRKTFSFKRIEGVNGELCIYLEIKDNLIKHLKFVSSSFVNSNLTINNIKDSTSTSDILTIYTSLFIVPMEVFI